MNYNLTISWTALVVGSLLITGCGGSEGEPEDDATPADTPRSIFAEDVAQGADAPNLPPLNTTLSFADGTPQLTEAVRAELATILASPQAEAGGRIVLRGHTDSEGADDLNLDMSRSMVSAVRDFLMEGGIAESRIELIAFDEQNPIAPNALPDGSPNEEGRAINRRVEITVETGQSVTREQTLIEALSESEAESAGQGAAQQPVQ